MLFTCRCEGESAVATDDRRDAVEDRRTRGRIPGQLRVVVGVQVDKAGCDDEAARIDRARGALAVDVGDEETVADTDVSLSRRCAGAVDDGAAANQEVEHVCPSGKG